MEWIISLSVNDDMRFYSMWVNYMHIHPREKLCQSNWIWANQEFILNIKDFSPYMHFCLFFEFSHKNSIMSHQYQDLISNIVCSMFGSRLKIWDRFTYITQEYHSDAWNEEICNAQLSPSLAHIIPSFPW